MKKNFHPFSIQTFFNLLKRLFSPGNLPGFTVFLVILAVIIHGSLTTLFFHWIDQARAIQSFQNQLKIPLPPTPLEIDSGIYLHQLRLEEDRQLNNYRWINPNQGLVSIPIDQAMRRLVEKGKL